MTVKVIAVDMDGTFLRDDKTYDRPRFEALLDRLLARDIRFVVASGNQYRQLRNFFPDRAAQLTFVGENGAHIVEQGASFLEQFQEPADIAALLTFLDDHYPEAVASPNGKRSSYILKHVPQAVKDWFRFYQPRMEEMASFRPLPEDDFFKVVLQVPDEQTELVLQAVNQHFETGSLEGTSSGFGCIDVISRGIDKGWALRQLLNQWQLTPDQLMAFGDGGNDISMLQLAGHSYAMANAPEAVKSAALYQAKSNQEDGVLAAIEAYLDQLDA